MSVSSPHFDPELYHIIHDVPVVDTFELVDSGWIDEAVPRMQALEKAGNVCPLILGHLDLSKKGREDDETPQVGLVRNWRKDEIKHLGPVVLADYWFRKDKLDEVREHCGQLVRWSADIWLKHKEIDPVSLLGPTTPARRLGTIQLTRDGETPVTLSRFQGGLSMPEPVKTPEDKKDDTKSLGMEQILKELEGLKTALSELLSKQEPAPETPGAPEAPGAGGEPEEMNDEELEKLIAELEQGKGGPKPTEKPVQSFASPGPTNVVQQSKDEELNARILRLESENARLQLSREIDALEDSGVMWADAEDKQADIDLLLALPKEMQTAQLARIKKKYAQAPVSGQPLDVVQNARTGVKEVFTEEMRDRAVSYASKNQLTFNAACVTLFKKAPGEFAN